MFEGNKESINKFDYFMELARDQAKLSKQEKYKKLGALLIDNNGLVLLSECNDYIEPVYSNPSILNKVERKLYSEHAERRIIYSALKKGISEMSDKT